MLCAILSWQTEAFDQAAGRRAGRSSAPPTLGLDRGIVEFDTPDFVLKLVKASQTVAALAPKGAGGFDFTPADMLETRARDGFFHLGDLTLRVRRADDEPWLDLSTAATGKPILPQDVSGDVLAAADLSPTLPADCPLQVTRSWLLVRDRFALRFDLKNQTDKAVQIGALGICYSVPFLLSDEIRNIEEMLTAAGRPVAVGVPGYILPTDLDGRLFLNHRSPSVMKLFCRPEKSEIDKYAQFVDKVLWGGIQCSEGPNRYGVRKSLFYYEPSELPQGTYDNRLTWRTWASWSKATSERIDRGYNYPHVAAAYWSMYRLARNHEGLVTAHPWDWYIDKALVSLGSILGYMPAVPHWAHNGNARRCWDFLYGGAPGRTSRVERQSHHYGSGLNVIPVLAEYRAPRRSLCAPHRLRRRDGGSLEHRPNATPGPCRWRPGPFGSSLAHKRTEDELRFDLRKGWRWDS